MNKYEKVFELCLTCLCFFFIVHAGGLLGWRLHPDGGDPNSAARWPKDEGGNGAAGGVGDRLHCGAYPMDGDEPRTARRAVSS